MGVDVMLGAALVMVGVAMVWDGGVVTRSNPYHLKRQAMGTVIAWVGVLMALAGAVQIFRVA